MRGFHVVFEGFFLFCFVLFICPLSFFKQKKPQHFLGENKNFKKRKKSENDLEEDVSKERKFEENQQKLRRTD